MTVQHFIDLFQQYGLPMMAAVFFCEYLNLPGFPAGVIMPAVGILIGQSELNLILSIGISIAASLAGCLVMYAICYYGGAPLLTKAFSKSPKFHHFMDRCHDYLEKGRGRGLFGLPAHPGAAHHRIHSRWTGPHAAARICRLVDGRHRHLEYNFDFLRLLFQRSVFKRQFLILSIKKTGTL